MRKTLLATTALAAATGMAAIASPASAAERLSLGVHGYFQAYFGYLEADNDDNRRNVDFFREAEIHFRGEVALDNGMKVGIDVQLEAETCGDQIDESYLYFQGDFGKLVLGSENSAAYLMSYGAPAADANFDGADPNYSPYGVGFAYAPNMTSDSEKITYFTPRFAGFGFGVSWTPDNTEDQNGATLPAFDNNNPGLGNTQNGIQENIWEFGLNYENKFGDFGVLAGMTYGFAMDTESDNYLITAGLPARVGIVAGAPGILPAVPAVTAPADEQEQFSAGLNLTFAGFTVGGGYLWDNQGLAGSNSREVFAAGLAWANGPLRLGASLAMQYDDSPADNDVDRYTIGAQYVYAPGMQLRATGIYYDTQTGNPNDIDDAIVAVVGTVITF